MGYINASHISAAIGTSQRFYIAAQGPLAGTVSDFWQMVWQCDVYVVVMLADVSSSNAQVHQLSAMKSAVSLRSQVSNSSINGYTGMVYWPQQDAGSLEFGEVSKLQYLFCLNIKQESRLQYKIVRQFGNQNLQHSITKLDLIHVPTGQQRGIWHLQYSEWTENGCPKDVSLFLSITNCSCKQCPKTEKYSRRFPGRA